MRVVVGMLAAVALSAVSFAGQAESRVTVPFDFEAGGRMMPAGDYELKMNETASTLKNLDGRGSVFLSPIPGGADGSFSNVTLMLESGQTLNHPQSAHWLGLEDCRAQKHSSPPPNQPK